MKVWPRDLDMRGKRVRLNDEAGTVVDIPKFCESLSTRSYILYDWPSGLAYQNTGLTSAQSLFDIVEIIEPVAVPDIAGAEKRGAELDLRHIGDMPDNAGAEKRGAELYGDPMAEPLHKRAHAAYHRIKAARSTVEKYIEACSITTGRAPETLVEAVAEMALAMNDLLPGGAMTDTVSQRTDHSKRIQKLRFRVQLEAQALSKQFPNIAERLAEIAKPQPGDLATLQEMRCIDDTTTDRDAVKKGES